MDTAGIHSNCGNHRETPVEKFHTDLPPRLMETGAMVGSEMDVKSKQFPARNCRLPVVSNRSARCWRYRKKLTPDQPDRGRKSIEIWRRPRTLANADDERDQDRVALHANALLGLSITKKKRMSSINQTGQAFRKCESGEAELAENILDN